MTSRACCAACCAPTRCYRRRRPTRAVSTGSGIALGYLPYLAARGVECHYIESAARVSGPSLTGRILRWVPRVRTYTQYRHWSDAHWHYGGSGFDAFEPVPAATAARRPGAGRRHRRARRRSSRSAG